MKNIRFYLDSMTEIYIYYDKLLFSKYNKKFYHLYILQITSSSRSQNKVLYCKLKSINFYNICHNTKLKHNHLLVIIIDNIEYLIQAKNRKKIVYNNQNNITLGAIKIKTNYLINILTSKNTLVLGFLYSVSQNNVLLTQ